MHGKSHRAIAAEAPESHSWNEAGNIVKLFAKYKPDVCQKPGLFLLTLLPPLTSLLYLLPSPSSSLRIFTRPSNPFFSLVQTLTLTLPMHFSSPFSTPLFSLLSDYGVDWSGVWEQCAHQLWWGSQLPEIPPHFLRPEPFIPPHWRGLGLSL